MRLTVFSQSVLLCAFLLSGCAAKRMQERALERLQPSAVSVEIVDGGWDLIVNGEPFFVKGVHYAPTWIGQEPGKEDEGWMDWAHSDPADRTIVATAKLRDIPILTKDDIIRNFYPDQGWGA